jgi:hypothetical protein
MTAKSYSYSAPLSDAARLVEGASAMGLLGRFEIFGLLQVEARENLQGDFAVIAGCCKRLVNHAYISQN